jgi:dTDP-4-dehydrorhamnose 3,5-epimerase
LELLDTHGAQAVVNAAGFNAVDAVESPDGWQKAMEANVELPRVWALAAKERGIPFVHISSDYVFSGEASEGAHREDDTRLTPVNAYGRSKLMGEEALRQAEGRSYIVRTSRVFGPRGPSPSSKRSFADLAISLALHQPTVSLVNDEWGCPSFSNDIVWGIAELLAKPWDPGVYHLVNDGGAISWEGFAREVYAHLGLTPTIASISGTTFAAKRAARVPVHLELVATRGPMLPPRAQAIARTYTGARPEPTGLAGATVLHSKWFADERGRFREAITVRALEAYGLLTAQTPFVQVNESVSKQGVLRGLHVQVPPFAQAKLVECLVGTVRDAIVDIRTGSPTYGKAFWIDLHAGDGQALWIPFGFAHGMLAKTEGATLRYTVFGSPYTKAAEGGLYPLDPALAIPWECADPLLHPRDAAWPVLADLRSPFA